MKNKDKAPAKKARTSTPNLPKKPVTVGLVKARASDITIETILEGERALRKGLKKYLQEKRAFGRHMEKIRLKLQKQQAAR